MNKRGRSSPGVTQGCPLAQQARIREPHDRGQGDVFTGSCASDSSGPPFSDPRDCARGLHSLLSSVSTLISTPVVVSPISVHIEVVKTSMHTVCGIEYNYCSELPRDPFR